MKNVVVRAACTMALVLAGHVAAAAQQPVLDRTILPVIEPEPPTYDELDARNATPPQRFEVTAPEGAPNVLIILIDDRPLAHASGLR